MSIENETDEICLDAVKQDGRALEYVENQNLELCIIAVEQYIEQYIEEEIVLTKIV